MNNLGTGRLARCCAVWVITTGAALGVLVWAVPDLPLPSTVGQASFDDLLVGSCALALMLCAAWWWGVTTVVVLGALRGTHPAHLGRGVPVTVRHWVLAACGLAVLTGGLSPAHATPGSLQRDDRPRTDARVEGILAGLPLPERPTGGLGEAAHHLAHVVVRPGDSLWRIATEALGPGADDVAVAAYWQHVHQLNRHVIGADPDLIRPGQHLLTPRPTPPRGDS